MTDEALVRFLLAVVTLVAAATLFREIFKKLRQPGVIGEIVGGIVLGPSLLGLLFPQASAWLFPKTGAVASGLFVLYQLGLLLLMFVTGARMRSLVSARMARSTSTIAVFGMVLPLLVGLGLTRLVDVRPMLGDAGNHTALTLVIAVAIAITSIPVISRIMADLDILQTKFARVVLAVAVVEDVALNVLVAIAVGLVATPAGAFGLQSLLGLDDGAAAIAYHALVPILIIAGTALLARRAHVLSRVVPRDPAFHEQATIASVTLAVVILSAAICLLLGTPPMYGAFVVGLLGSRVLPAATIDSIDRLSAMSFVPIYFAMIGLRVDLVHGFDLAQAAVFITVACLVKTLSVYIGSRVGGENAQGSLDFAITLNARGGPGIVLAGVALDAAIISMSFFTTLVLTAIVTSLIAGAWLERAVRHGRIRPEPATAPGER